LQDFCTTYQLYVSASPAGSDARAVKVTVPGKMLVGAELVLDAEKREPTIETVLTNPIQLTKVRKD